LYLKDSNRLKGLIASRYIAMQSWIDWLKFYFQKITSSIGLWLILHVFESTVSGLLGRVEFNFVVRLHRRQHSFPTTELTIE
jgi:hypothetical protein